MGRLGDLVVFGHLLQSVNSLAFGIQSVHQMHVVCVVLGVLFTVESLAVPESVTQ